MNGTTHGAVMPNVWLGESLRWYLKRARHPLKNYIVGHYWHMFAKVRVWIRYDGGGLINVGLGDYLQQQIFFDGYYERPLVDWLKANLRPDDVFWDVGANIGAISLVAAGLCRRVVAFEPDPRSLERLRNNVGANDLRNVEIVAGALGVESGTATLYQAPSSNTGMTSLVPGRAQVIGEQHVPVFRADDLVARRPEIAPTVMKLDVEGAERLVLGGATDLLRSGHLRALVFEDRRDTDGRPASREVVERLVEAGYRIESFASSDGRADDGMYNFLATCGLTTPGSVRSS
jgi:FkbM family methyltransferase